MGDTQRSFRIVEDPRYQEHRGPTSHPERPQRLEAVGQALGEVASEVEALPARPAEEHEVLRVHGAEHWQTIESAARRAPGQLDPDTYVSPASFEVARLAAGAVVDLARSVARGEARSGLAAVRPPGHHAEAGRAMGFCLFNNVAVAARALQAEEGLEKILILDWDVHHGNGTQHSFESDPSVFYASTHQFPYYPGTGDAGEAGVGAGEGTTLNVPFPAGCGDDEYIGALQRLVSPAARWFRPQMILISCGFDAHRDDPLASMGVSGEGFLAMTRIVRALADELCDGRIAFVLEGGYAASGLLDGTRAVLRGMLEPEPGALPSPVSLDAGTPLRGVVDRVAAVHRGRIADLGAA